MVSRKKHYAASGFLFLALMLGAVRVGAGTLQFDGTDDRVRWTTLATALQNVSDGAWTMAVLFKRSTVSDDGVGEGLAYLLTSGGAAQVGVSLRDAAGTSNDSKPFIDVGSGPLGFQQLSSTTSPYLLVVHKASGTTTPAYSWKLGSGGAWTHDVFDITLANGSAAGILEVGAWEASDFFAGWIGVVAFWEGQMSQTNREALDDNWQTSDWYNSAHGTPAVLIEFNVACTSLVDLIGNASSRSCTGTTLDSGETMNSWNYNGTGAGGGAPTRNLTMMGVGS